MNSADEAYKEILKKRIERIDKEISEVQYKINERNINRSMPLIGKIRVDFQHDHKIDKLDEKLYALNAERELLLTEKRIPLKPKVEDKIEKQEKKHESIQNEKTNAEFESKVLEKALKTETEKLKTGQSSPDRVAKLNDKLTEKREQIESLKKKGAIITENQYRIMLPRYLVLHLKQSLILRQIGKKAYLVELLKHLDNLAQENELVNNPLKKAYNDLKYKRSQKKINKRILHTEKMIDEMSNFENKNIFLLYGTSIIVMAKEAKERIVETIGGNKQQQTR